MSAALFTEFVSVCFDGNQSDAAEALAMDRSSVCRMCSGDRGVSPAIAQQCEAIAKQRVPKMKGHFRKEAFVWPDEVVA